MKKIFATVVKEWILSRRDVGGLMLLFLMPALLIMVMALVQDGPFKDYQEIRFDLLLADNDRGSLAQEIKTGLKQSRNFNIVDSIDGQPLTDEKLKELLQAGKYTIGIVIPKGATAEVVNSANIVANSISERLGLGTLPSRESRDSAYIRMYFDPVSKPTFRLSISNALDKYVTYSCSNVLIKRLSKLSRVPDDSLGSNVDFKKVFQGIGVKEEPLNNKGDYRTYVNSVQHNVPAWAIFGMFFIVLPIVTHTIKEREEGSALRLELIPGAYRSVAMGKILFYTILCTAQFICMFCVGLWILPLLGLPKLYLGVHSWVLLPVAVSIAFAATSYGYFVGAAFKTINQATPFGAISVVLLSAMGGIWVPIELLPPVMQKVALISPLHWGLGAVHHLILRNGNFYDVLPNIAMLLGLGTVLWLVSIYLNRTRRFSF